jgi:hypothetical protein
LPEFQISEPDPLNPLKNHPVRLKNFPLGLQPALEVAALVPAPSIPPKGIRPPCDAAQDRDGWVIQRAGVAEGTIPWGFHARLEYSRGIGVRKWEVSNPRCPNRQ